MTPDRVAVQRTEPAEAADEGYPLSEPGDTARSEVSGEERARYLAGHGAERLLEAGLTEFGIDRLAERFIGEGGAGDVDAFVEWALSVSRKP